MPNSQMAPGVVGPFAGMDVPWLLTMRARTRREGCAEVENAAPLARDCIAGSVESQAHRAPQVRRELMEGLVTMQLERAH